VLWNIVQCSYALLEMGPRGVKYNSYKHAVMLKYSTIDSDRVEPFPWVIARLDRAI
jgi:hypothetical protein